MANIIKARISLNGAESDIRAINEKIGEEFDFNAVIPCPAELAELKTYEQLKSVGEERSRELKAKYGYDNPYEWRMEHWNTKDGNRAEEVFGETHPYDDWYFLATSDGFPYPVIEELSKQFPAVRIEFVFADEERGYHAGKGEYLNGVLTGGDLEDESEEANGVWDELNPDADEWDEDEEDWDEEEE